MFASRAMEEEFFRFSVLEKEVLWMVHILIVLYMYLIIMSASVFVRASACDLISISMTTMLILDAQSSVMTHDSLMKWERHTRLRWKTSLSTSTCCAMIGILSEWDLAYHIFPTSDHGRLIYLGTLRWTSTITNLNSIHNGWRHAGIENNQWSTGFWLQNSGSTWDYILKPVFYNHKLLFTFALRYVTPQWVKIVGTYPGKVRRDVLDPMSSTTS